MRKISAHLIQTCTLCTRHETCAFHFISYYHLKNAYKVQNCSLASYVDNEKDLNEVKNT